MGAPGIIKSQRISIADSITKINEFYYDKGWTDGLPIIPPTEELVQEFLKYTHREPDETVTVLPPRWVEATVEKIAINSVMAGCLPEYLPTVITAIEAMGEKQFNLNGIQVTTHPVAPLLIINGPIRNKLKLNSRGNALGQGNRANATIGRAIRLCLLNIGGGLPGTVDKAVQGMPGKYTYCTAENEEENPWQPLHVERGFSHEQSTVTVIGAEGPHNINDHAATTANGVLTTIAGTIKTQGNNNVIYQVGEVIIVLGPEHATTIARDGYSKSAIKKYLWDKSRIPKSWFSTEHRERQFSHYDENDLIPIVPKSDNIVVVVVGGPGKHSQFIPTFGDTYSVTKEIR